MTEPLDVIVVGAGNAALCAALAAAEAGARVLVLERAPEAESGGNSSFTAGAFRCVYDGVDDLRALMPDLTDAEVASADFGTYTEGQFFDDMGRITEYRTDPELCELLVTRSRPTMRWMQGRGVRFMPIWGRQAYRIDGRFKFWGGLTVEAWGGGPGLVDTLYRLARAAGVVIRFGAKATGLIVDDDGVHGVIVRQGGQTAEVRAKAVVLACGGFESNPEWRTRYLGPGWDLAKVRGTRFNTGEGIRMALDAGAAAYGNWSGCHAVGWDRNAPEFGDLEVGDGFQKHSYPLGVLINAAGERFVDEGADFRNFTYAKYGRAILAQPGQFAWQVFDAKVAPLLRDEYRIKRATRVRADTLEELVGKLEDVDAASALATLRAFNEAVKIDVPFDPNIKDGRGTLGLTVPKSNWANPLDTPPFDAFAVTCGVTFTFGGLKIDRGGQVIDQEGEAIPGLYAAGELVGGLFYNNYPGGSGLMAGSVFGKIAGGSAGAHATA
ncbi:MAG TPA: FAD-dependent tricarballylate dehydrogenase TcuA [Caulobacteraceae bacterium]|jgi:tricarballylate dehydrogenase|nr:FAD-dependent tricarballylate dehydrogenase TcuA [Caulobacteraceae bacterium]